VDSDLFEKSAIDADQGISGEQKELGWVIIK